MTVDVVVIGAGAAGLAAAVGLARRGIGVHVLEARDRIGGRMLTRNEPGLDYPVELGAEFVHGRPAATFELLAAAGAPAVDVRGTRWTLLDGALARADTSFADLQRALEQIGVPSRDIAFAEFLQRNAARVMPASLLRFARNLVEGYDAADAERVSTLETVAAWRGAGAANAPAFRPVGGYAVLIDELKRALDAARVSVRLQSIVERVRWRHGHVDVHGMRFGEPFSIAARRAVVTLPVGVLAQPQAGVGAVRFEPSPAPLEAGLAGLEMGAAVKLVLRFRTRFWESIAHGRYDDAAFLHAPGAMLPTFWTALPHRVPLLTAWSGGPRARRLASAGESAVVAEAVQTLGKIFGEPRTVERELEGVYWHDWMADPFAQGAYSFVRVGGAEARRRLATPADDTLFFAGEAADVDGQAATVAGAVASGARAASVLAATLQ